MTEAIVKADSQYAARMFDAEIKWASGIGPSQVAHFYTKLTEEFGSKSFGGGITAFREDIIAKHGDLSAAGVVDRYEDSSVIMSAVSLPVGQGLSVRFEDGDNLLIAWEENGDERLDLTVVPWRDKAPPALIGEMKELVAGGSTHAGLTEMAQRLARYSCLGLETRDLFYSGLPVSIDDIRGFIQEHGFERTGWVSGLGTYQSLGRRYGDVYILSVEARAYHPGVIGYMQKLCSVFTPTAEVRGEPQRTAHTLALLDGSLRSLFNSACTLSLEFNLNRGLGGIADIVSACDKLDLSSEAAFAYGDTDRIVYAERRDQRDLYMHTNIDLNEGCAYGTVISRSETGYDRCDVYLASRWGSGFGRYFRDGKSVNERVAYGYIQSVINGSGAYWIDEDRLVDALDEPTLPKEGRVFSYDFRTREMEIDSRLAVATGYLDYFRLMTKGDRKALTDAVEGKFQEGDVGFILRSRAEGQDAKSRTVDPEEYMAGLTDGGGADVKVSGHRL
nr:hypothetical protein [Neorhizobium tomejilense]